MNTYTVQPLYSVHCTTVYTVHVLHSVPVHTLYSVHCFTYIKPTNIQIHCTLHRIHCTLHSVHCAYTTHCNCLLTLNQQTFKYTVHYTEYTIDILHSILCNYTTMYIHCTVYTVHTLHSLHCSYTTQCTLYTKLFTVNTLHSVHCFTYIKPTSIQIHCYTEYTVYHTVHTIHVLHRVHCTLQRVHCTYPTQSTLLYIH